MLPPSSLAVISNAIRDPHRRGHAIGAWASSIGIGLAAGPWLTALIIDSLGANWTWLYAAPQVRTPPSIRMVEQHKLAVFFP
jgi:MFS family permease